jgi:hypothetical protein
MTDNLRPVVIYISAASDLMAEREGLARMIAHLPVSLTWQVIQTPLGQERLDLSWLDRAELHILVMGGDIRAPVGLELYAAREAGCPTIAFIKRNIVRTTAGDIFSRDSRLSWQPFTGSTDLSRQVQQRLSDHLLSRALHFSLTLAEIEQLETLRQQKSGPASETSTGTEAGHSALILSTERYTPREGVIVEGES